MESQEKSVENIFKNKLKIDTKLMTSSVKIKKLHISVDNDIIDNNQLSIEFVNKILDIRNKKILKWAMSTPRPCKFIIEIYHPNKDTKFIELVSLCSFILDDASNLNVIYMDSIKVYDSIEINNNNIVFPISLIQPFLFYLKNKSLISNMNFSIKPISNEII
jgi:hypothetical protein